MAVLLISRRYFFCNNGTRNSVFFPRYQYNKQRVACKSVKPVLLLKQVRKLDFNVSHFFSLPDLNKHKEYRGRKLVGYTMEQMFNVVSDVENYRNFVPFCKKSNVKSRTPTELRGELEIGFPPMVENYTSHVILRKPHLVKAECVEGKMFKHLTTIWKFKKGLKDRPQTCLVDFYVSFEFKSLVHSQIANMFFNELVSQMETAFFAEAVQRYGKPSIKTVAVKKKT